MSKLYIYTPLANTRVSQYFLLPVNVNWVYEIFCDYVLLLGVFFGLEGKVKLIGPFYNKL